MFSKLLYVHDIKGYWTLVDGFLRIALNQCYSINYQHTNSI